MPAAVKGFLSAGIGGAIAYAVVYAVMDAVVTGTTAADNLFTSIVPLVIAAGVVWLIVSFAFKG